MTTTKARATGAVFVLYVLAAVLAMALISRAPIAYSNAVNLIANAVYFAYAVLLYRMFKPVGRGFALLALAICFVGCVLQSLPLFHIGSLRNALPIFGLFNLTIGYLICKSTFLPRTLGILMMLSGLGGLTLLSPALTKQLFTYVLMLDLAAEGSLVLWLLVRGVNVERWNKQAAIERI